MWFGDRRVVAVDALDLDRGQMLGIVGETGSGKSMTAYAIAGLAPGMGARVEGSVKLEGRELIGLSDRELRDIRGRQIAMIFQAPISSLNPVFRVGDMFLRALRLHGASKAEARERAAVAMRSVALSPDLLHRYPHQLSGGQAQRVAIALAVALRAEVLIADEPTSALDVTVQAEILEVLQKLRAEESLAALFISHDLAVVSRDLRHRRDHARRGGRRARPRRANAPPSRAPVHARAAGRRSASDRAGRRAMLEVRDLVVRYGHVVAVDGVSLSVPPGPAGLGLVGESGSGKTTIGRTIVRLTTPTSGEVTPRRRRRVSGSAERTEGVPQERPDRVPGSGLDARPADARRRGDHRGAASTRHRRPRRLRGLGSSSS